MGLGHIILLILRLKRLNFASNMAVDSNTPIFGTLIFKFQQVRVARPQIRPGLTMADLASKLYISKPAVSMCVRRGERIAQKMDIR